MSDHDCLSVASRRSIYECVVQHAGAHLRDVARRSGMPLGTALYHLDRLEEAGLVAARRDGRYKRYFTSQGMGRREKEVVSLLRHDVPRRIVYALLSSGPATQRTLCETIGVSRSTLSFHVNRLLVAGLVGRTETRPEGIYALAEPDLARDLLSRFQGSLSPEDAARYPLAAPVAATASPAAAGPPAMTIDAALAG
jgi:predicted transcriptional regulator